MAQITALDKFVAYFSPSAGARRMRDRIAFERLQKISQRSYDGASAGRRTSGWTTISTSANAEIFGALHRLRDRSRDLVRNDSHASRAVSIISTNVVDTGIVPTAIGGAKAKTAKANALWKAWGETSACDYSGGQNFYGLQTLTMRSVPEGGEALVRRRRAKSSDNLPVPLQIQLLEGDFLDTYMRHGEVLPNGNYIKAGIEFNPQGKRVAYYLWENHPGEMGIPFNTFKSERVPAEDIIPVYRQDRVGQIRGIPWGAPIILKLRDLNDADDAHLLRQKIGACFAAFVYDTDGADIVNNPDGTSLVDKLEPGTIEFLPPGKDIKFGTPPDVSGYVDFIRSHQRQVAIGYDITYEALTGDYSQVNYSSARMGYIQMQKNIRNWQWNMLIPSLCDGVYRWFIEAASIGVTDLSGISASWTTPRVDMIDPTKEIAAAKDEVRAGFKSLPEAIRERGNDPDQVFKEISETNATLDKLGITLDTDPRNVTEFGQEQPSLYTGKSGGGSDKGSDTSNSNEGESK